MPSGTTSSHTTCPRPWRCAFNVRKLVSGNQVTQKHAVCAVLFAAQHLLLPIHRQAMYRACPVPLLIIIVMCMVSGGYHSVLQCRGKQCMHSSRGTCSAVLLNGRGLAHGHTSMGKVTGGAWVRGTLTEC